MIKFFCYVPNLKRGPPKTEDSLSELRSSFLPRPDLVDKRLAGFESGNDMSRYRNGRVGTQVAGGLPGPLFKNEAPKLPHEDGVALG